MLFSLFRCCRGFGAQACVRHTVKGWSEQRAKKTGTTCKRRRLLLGRSDVRGTSWSSSSRNIALRNRWCRGRLYVALAPDTKGKVHEALFGLMAPRNRQLRDRTCCIGSVKTKSHLSNYIYHNIEVDSVIAETFIYTSSSRGSN